MIYENNFTIQKPGKNRFFFSDLSKLFFVCIPRLNWEFIFSWPTLLETLLESDQKCETSSILFFDDLLKIRPNPANWSIWTVMLALLVSWPTLLVLTYYFVKYQRILLYITGFLASFDTLLPWKKKFEYEQRRDRSSSRCFTISNLEIERCSQPKLTFLTSNRPWPV